MNKIIEIKRMSDSTVDVIMENYTGETYPATMFKIDYEIHVAKQEIKDSVGEEVWKKIAGLVELVASKCREEGYDSGYGDASGMGPEY